MLPLLSHTSRCFNSAFAGSDNALAKVMFQYATENNKIEPIEKELAKVRDLITSPSSKYSGFLTHYSISDEEKVAPLVALCQAENISKPVTTLFHTLATNNSLETFDELFTDYQILAKKSRGEVDMIVTVAKTPSATEMKEIEKWTFDNLRDNPKEKPLITTEIDPSVIGGFSVWYGDRYADKTIISRFYECMDNVDSLIDRVDEMMKKNPPQPIAKNAPLPAWAESWVTQPSSA